MTITDPDERAVLQGRYEATTYRVATSDIPIDLRVGRVCPEMDSLLAASGASIWTFLSAANPRSKPLCLQENRKRHETLMQWLDDSGYVYLQGEGIPDEAGWHPEPSVLIFGMRCEDAAELARRFLQNAVLCGSLGEPSLLVW